MTKDGTFEQTLVILGMCLCALSIGLNNMIPALAGILLMLPGIYWLIKN